LEDLDMFGVRTCLLVALLAGATSIATAKGYVLPTGVTVLTEEQLLNQIIGNTLVYGYEHHVEYFEPPTGDQKKGRFKGKSAPLGRYGGSWEVKENLMCWRHDESHMVKYNICNTIVLDGDIVTFYETNGYPWYNSHPPIKLISGNP
jgi:hypothetical protein